MAAEAGTQGDSPDKWDMEFFTGKWLASGFADKAIPTLETLPGAP